MLKSIFARIWAFWGLVSFALTFLIIFLPSMLAWLIPDPAGMRYFCSIAHGWMSVWLPLVGCSVRVKGKSHFKKGEAYIVCSNHNSMLDIPLTTPFMPAANKTIAKSSFSKIPLFGWYYMKGSVLVDRKSEASRKSSYIKMKAVLDKGIQMCIYPEGTRNRTDQPLKKFHDGAFRLSVETGHSIMPCILFNTKKALPVHKSFYFLPTKLEMHYLEPVSPAGKTVDQLRDEVFAIMSMYYSANRN